MCDAVTAPERVLLVHPGALGDLIQALPALGAVRAGLPRAHVVLLTDQSLAGFATQTGLFDVVRGFDMAAAYTGSAGGRLRVLAALATQARRARPDVAGVFKGAPVYAAVALASGARRRAGLARGIGCALLTHPVPVDPARHHEDRYLDVVAALGLDGGRRADAAWPRVSSHIPASVRARAWPLVGLGPGGARNAKQDMATKRWPAERFAALGRELAADLPDAAFVLLGGAGDRAEVDLVRAALPPGRVIDLAGRTDLAAARSAIALLDVYVGNDSGLMHVAATTATPAVIAFGPTDPRVIAPRAAGLRAVWRPVDRPPCYDEVDGTHRPCRTPCCIERVAVRDVRAAVDAALAGVVRAGRPLA